MRVVRKILVGLGAVVGVFAAVLTAVVLARQNRRFDAPYPAIHASSDEGMIARGRYLVYGPAHCAGCHGETARVQEAEAGARVPLSGGKLMDTPVAAFFAPNLTPDKETGIGAFRDDELARSLRHGVGTDGRALMPFMPFQNMSDEDLSAVLSFLRSEAPVHNAVPPHDWTALGRAVKALMLEPVGPRGEPPTRVAKDDPVVYGRYLAYSVSNCYGCHTERNMRTGAFTGAPFAGGLRFDAKGKKGVKIVSPNLTPDPKTGRIASWSEEVFVARFKLGGAVVEGTHMPWGSFRNMTEADLKAIYGFLRSLAPVDNPNAVDPSSSKP